MLTDHRLVTRLTRFAVAKLKRGFFSYYNIRACALAIAMEVAYYNISVKNCTFCCLRKSKIQLKKHTHTQTQQTSVCLRFNTAIRFLQSTGHCTWMAPKNILQRPMPNTRTILLIRNKCNFFFLSCFTRYCSIIYYKSESPFFSFLSN